MSETRVLLGKIQALRQRLEQAQGLANEARSAAAATSWALSAKPAGSRCERVGLSAGFPSMGRSASEESDPIIRISRKGTWQDRVHPGIVPCVIQVKTCFDVSDAGPSAPAPASPVR